VARSGPTAWEGGNGAAPQVCTQLAAAQALLRPSEMRVPHSNWAVLVITREYHSLAPSGHLATARALPMPH
jgi:hypothetical protein